MNVRKQILVSMEGDEEIGIAENGKSRGNGGDRWQAQWCYADFRDRDRLGI